jgi:hypothetical protein
MELAMGLALGLDAVDTQA